MQFKWKKILISIKQESKTPDFFYICVFKIIPIYIINYENQASR